MEWLNYHHLFYFYTVAREGGVTAAANRLLLAQSTLSAQIGELEDRLGARLFEKVGRRLVLTPTGRTVMQYADEIFGLGREMLDVVRGGASNKPLPFLVGVSDALPKLVVHQLLEPALRLPTPVSLVVTEGKVEPLLAELAIHALDMVLSDAPAAPYLKVRAHNRLVGDCPVSVLGAPSLAAKYRPGFPRSLDGAPFVMPLGGTALRRSLDQWFDQMGITPTVAAQVDDSALAKVMGAAGVGLFFAPSTIEAQVRRQFRAQVVGHIDDVRERFYVISTERKLRHIAAQAVVERAKERSEA